MIKLKDFKIPILKKEDNSIILICVIKNEYLLLDYFIKHYSYIGVSHFIFIDNNSSDDSREYLLTHDANIMLLVTDASYKENEFGTNWVITILFYYCQNKWCVVVDADEIIYKNNLNMLRQKMKIYGANVCPFYLLDMYPKNNEILYKKGDPFLKHSNYYDKESPINRDYFSGVRKRVFDIGALLEKKSFFKYTFACCGHHGPGYHRILNHRKDDKHIKCVKFYNDTQILLHFKYIKPNLKEIFTERVKQNQDWNNSLEYRAYETIEHFNLFHPEHSLCINENEPNFSFI
jgi:hypothetical protein